MTRSQRATLIAFIAFLWAAHEARSIVVTAIALTMALIAAYLFVNGE